MKQVINNLKNGEVTHIDREGLFATIKQCKIKTKKKGSYLDYWWALILIVAITFFVYTQSSSRLNKMNIRRK